MAQRTTVVLLDDLDGDVAEHTVEFGVDGATYEIDLTDAHAAALRETLAPYIASARRAQGRPTSPAARRDAPATAPSAPRTPPPVDREQNKAIREWAARHGHTLSPRGRIPGAVADAFHRGDPTGLPHDAGDAAPTDAAQSAEPAEPAAPTATDTGSRVGPDGLTGDEREQIRAWALEEGIDVKPRGRLSKDLISNYRATQARR